MKQNYSVGGRLGKEIISFGSAAIVEVKIKYGSKTTYL